MSKGRARLDKVMVERGLVQSRTRAQVLVMAGEVIVNGEVAVKSSTLIPLDAVVELVSPMPFVSRGGQKLSAAIHVFGIDLTGRICADVGACTGGFTDAMIQNGAARVYAIDVGYGQLDWKLRQDSRVVLMERTNARHLQALPEKVSFVAVDVSFISLKLILPAVCKWLDSESDVVTLIKPQFEAGRRFVGKGGVIRDPTVHRRVLSDLLDWFGENGLGVFGLLRSPVTGSSGNVEFLTWLRPDSAGPIDTESAILSVTSSPELTAAGRPTED